MRLTVASMPLCLAVRIAVLLVSVVLAPLARAVILTPVVSSVDRSTLGPLQPVVISGANFTGATSVKLAGATVPSFSVAGDGNSIATFAPASGWTTGVVSVTTPAGTGTSSFSVTFASPTVVPGAFGATTLPAGAGTVFTMSAYGTGTLRYQWKKEGAPVAPAAGNLRGVNSLNLQFFNSQQANAGNYTLTVTDDIGSATSTVAKVTVTDRAPDITTPPASFTVAEGGSAVLGVAASGTAPLSYLWKKGTDPVPGATTSVLSFPSITAAQAGTYTVVVSNSLAPTGVTSAPAVATVTPGAPTITTQPAHDVSYPGNNVVFTVVATGTGPLTYQWKKDNVALTDLESYSGTTTAALKIANVSSAHEGLYQVVVTGAQSPAATSNTVKLSLGNPGTWQWRNAKPYGGAYFDVAYGGGRYVAVGNGGGIVTSTDGTTWTAVTPRPSVSLLDVAYGAGRFVAVGSNGTALSSSDGTTWIRGNLIASSFVRTIIHDGTQFVAAGNNGVVATSTDGLNWTQRVSPSTGATINSLVYGMVSGSPRYVASSGGADVYTSADLVTWTTVSLAGSPVVQDIVYGNGFFYAACDANVFLRSADGGATWVTGDIDTTTAHSWVGLATSGSGLAAVSSTGGVATSTDGLTWTLLTTNSPAATQFATTFQGISYVNGQFMAVGLAGEIFTSSTGATWVARHTTLATAANTFRAVATDGTTYAAVGDSGLIANSPTGTTWTARTSPTTSNLTGLAYAGGKYVATAASGAVLVSSDSGDTWSSATTPAASLTAVAYNGSAFFAVGGAGEIVSSSNGSVWTAKNSNTTQPLRAIAANAAQVVAVGDAGAATYSSDGGATWTPVTAGTGEAAVSLTGVAYGAGKFVAVGSNQALSVRRTIILTSSNGGATWTRQPVPYSASVNGITFAFGRFMAVGGTLSVLTSADGVNWSADASISGLALTAVTAGTSSYMAVGPSLEILAASSALPPMLASVIPAAVAPGVVVTLTGANFTDASSVTFNGVAATTFTVNSATQITATVPVGFNASGPVRVTTPGGTTVATHTAAYLQITSQPQALVTGTVGGSVNLSVSATGSGLTYQWRKYGQPINGATGTTLGLSGLTLFDAGLYDVLVRSSGVDAPSTASRVVVNPAVNPAAIVTAAATNRAGVETAYASFETIYRAPDGKVYVSGNFSSLFGAPRPGYARLNADGSLDTSFVPVPAVKSTGVNRVTAFAVQADGKVLIGGDFSLVGGYPRVCLARLNLDGSLDRSFEAATSFNAGQLYALAVQTDGKILAAGSFNDSGGNIARLNADGTLDATFRPNSSHAFDGSVYALAVQSDGKIVVGGNFFTFNSTSVGKIARLTTTGELDTAFTTATGSGFDYVVKSLGFQSDGKIIVGGEFTDYSGTSRKGLVRLATSGALDTTFSAGLDGAVKQVAIQTNDAIVIAGDFNQVSGATSNGIARLLATGARDTAFNTGSDANAGFNYGTGGAALLTGNAVLVLSNAATRYNSETANVGQLTRLSSTAALDAGYSPSPRSAGNVITIVPAPNGKWVIAGEFTHVNGLPRFNIAQLNADGSTDTSFAPTANADNSNGRFHAVVVQPDGKVIAGGEFTSYQGVTAGNIIRFEATGALDSTFVTGTGFTNGVYALALQADGKVIAGGGFDEYNGTTRRALARLTKTGDLDSSFTQPGSGMAGFMTVRTLAVIPDGRIYAGGNFTSYGTKANRLARFNVNGSLDATFATGEGFNSTVLALLVQADGKIVVGGEFNAYQSTTTKALARLLSTGDFDTSFAPGEAANVTSLALQGDGKILFSGYFNTVGSNPFQAPHLARLTSSGAIDTTFRVPGLGTTPNAVQIDGAGSILVVGGNLLFPGQLAAGLAKLELAPGPVITTPPAPQVASLGGSVTFSATITGSSLLYQWKKDGVALAGATAPSYVIPSAQVKDVGSYSVTASNVFGAVTSTPVTLSGSGAAPTITGQPASVAAITGSAPVLSVTATGATAYQWRKLGQPIAGATNSSFTLTSVTAGDAGFYDVLTANGLSVTRSAPARVSVAPGASLQGRLATDRSFAAIFEPTDSYGVPNLVYAQPDGAYYIAGTNISSIDGNTRIGLARFSATGVIDPTYAPEIGGGPIYAMARQTDGKLIIAGDFYRVNGIESPRLARLNADGTLDLSFAHGTDAGTYDTIRAVAVQTDGKIIIGGDITSYGGEPSGNRLARLNTDGTLDTAFRTALGTGFSGQVFDVAVHTDGRIYVVGNFTQLNGVNATNLAVLNTDGSRYTLADFPTNNFDSERTIYSIAVRPDGRMVLGGNFATFGGKGSGFILGLTAAGALDTTFSASSGPDAAVRRIVRVSDGTFYVVGDFTSFDEHSAMVAHLTANGAFDRGYSFGSSPASIALGAGNELLAVGGFYTASDGTATLSRNQFARYTSAGVLTSSQIMRWGQQGGFVKALVPAPGGKWLAGGYFAQVMGVLTPNLVRLNGDGSIDTSFSTAGRPLFNQVSAIAVQGDGKILVGGTFTDFGSDERAGSYFSVGHLVRLNADGTFDSTFAIGSGFDGNVSAIAIQPDGRIVVGGEFFTFNGQVVSPRLVRLQVDGGLDTSFQAGTGLDASPQTIVVQRDEKLLIGGDFAAYNSATTNVSKLIRLLANGALETAFTVAGGRVAVIQVQPDDAIVIGGNFTSVGGQARAGVARLSAAGVFDATFNSADIFQQIEATPSIYSLALQSDGKVVVSGYFDELVAGTGTRYLARLTVTGAFDSTFTLPYVEGVAEVLALRADGSLLLGGGSLALNTVYRYGLMAVTGNTAVPAPVIGTQPSAVIATSGGNANFSVSATATGALTYQWRRNGFALEGATTATLALTGVKLTDADFYDVVVTANGASTASEAARLSVAPTAYPNGLRMDPTYNPLVQTDSARVSVVLVDPVGGKIYVGGSFNWVDGSTRDQLLRLNGDYSVDTAWTPPTFSSRVTALALQPDGKLVVGGLFLSVGGQTKAALARLNSDGTLDADFGGTSGPGAVVSRIVVLPDGKLLVAGSFPTYGGITRNGLARANSDGTLDLTFNAGLNAGAAVAAILRQSDGSLLIGGSISSVGGVGRSNFAKLSADGVLDTAFAHTGEASDLVRVIAPAPGNKIFIAGDFTSYNGTPINRIACIEADGTLDTGFVPGTGFNASVLALAVSGSTTYASGTFTSYNGTALNGLAKINGSTVDASFNPKVDDSSAVLALDTAGHLLVGGIQTTAMAAGVTPTAEPRKALARFSTAGALDEAPRLNFRSTGTVLFAQQMPAGGVVIAGTFTWVNGTAAGNLARLNADGTTDTSLVTGTGIGGGSILSTVLQPDGRLLLAGTFTTYKGAAVPPVIRVMANGDLDTGFTVAAGAFGTNTVTFATLLSGGRVMVGGLFTNVGGVTRNGLAVLKADGTLDATFNPGAGPDTFFLTGGATAQPDGRVVVRGTFTSFGGVTGSGLVRLNADGSVDHTFMPAKGFTSGTSVVSPSDFSLAPNGKYLATGGFTAYDGTPIGGLARLTSTGGLDASFALTAAPNSAPTRVIPQPDGRIVVRGSFTSFGATPVTGLLARLNADSTLDPSLQVFGINSFTGAGPVVPLDNGSVILGGSYFAFEGQSRSGLVRLVASTGILPVVTTPPVAQGAVYGGTATFSVVATGQPTPTFQWQRNGDDIPGATNASYTVAFATQATQGDYRVKVTNAAGSVFSASVPFNVLTRNIVNFYARAKVAAGAGATIASSFTIEGTQSKTVLLIGVGGARANGGNATGSLADPRLAVFNAAGTSLGSNDNWTTGNTTALTALASQVGATPGLSSSGEGGKDAALQLTLPPGTYHVVLDDVAGAGGVGMLQIYDADTDGRPRLVMATLRATVGAGANVITAGFTIDGLLAKTVLLRALGESLGASNGVLEDPTISLYQGSTLFRYNDDTSFGESGVPLAFSQVGARPTSGTYDATLVETIAPGAYTVTVAPVNSSESGTVLLELFEADAQRSAVIAPVITYLPPDQKAIQGTSAYFGVVAVAKPAATYQWLKNGEPIGGATNTVLRVDNVQTTNVGSYTVTVTSGANSVTSQPRTIFVLPEFHTADTDRDHQIGLLELTRVIQLYNYRNGSERTGEYHTLAGTEDGFTLGPGAITAYHSADTNHDGRIDANELSRVIELYSYVEDTIQTGAYHAVVGTEDGFAPGPVVSNDKGE